MRVSAHRKVGCHEHVDHHRHRVHCWRVHCLSGLYDQGWPGGFHPAPRPSPLRRFGRPAHYLWRHVQREYCQADVRGGAQAGHHHHGEQLETAPDRNGTVHGQAALRQEEAAATHRKQPQDRHPRGARCHLQVMAAQAL